MVHYHELDFVNRGKQMKRQNEFAQKVKEAINQKGVLTPVY
jgi:hypothetical protein